MAEVTFLGSLKEESRKDYIAIFETEWPLWVGGILLAFLAIMMVLWARPWGVAAGIRNWGDWIFYFIGVRGAQPTSPLLHTTSVMNIGLLAYLDSYCRIWYLTGVVRLGFQPDRPTFQDNWSCFDMRRFRGIIGASGRGNQNSHESEIASCR